jgi:hypothetical protein
MGAGRMVIAVVIMCAAAGRALCQTPASTQDQPTAAVNNDSNPTRAVLFSIRPEFYAPAPSVSQGALIFRYDQATLRQRRWLPGQRGVILRFELPVSYTHVGGTAQQAGLGDGYAQLLLAPYFTRRFAFVVGSGLQVPTASDRLLGSGKWIVAPAVGPLWFFAGRGLLFIKLQNLSSIGGDSTRPDVNFLLITPTFLYGFKPRWWLLADTETRTNWLLDGRTGVKSGLQVGHVFAPQFGAWVKPEMWWGPNQNGWNLKFGLVWYR